uniref:Myb/SANT-like DNA-binding domain-containing protein n=1 Tax=Anopheles culicifacies TaxID=139723 RepID=A0A182M2F7_9DIPT
MATTSAASEGVSIRLSGGRISQKQRAPSDGTDSSSCSTREPWISTNKILNSSLCGRRVNSRNPNFDYDETKLLISLWGDPVVQKTLITTHKKHPVIAELAQKMRDHGYNRSTEEIKTRIKNLKCFYNHIKKDMAAGIINQTTWRHYAEMDEIISRPVFGNAHRLYMQQQTKQQPQKQEQAAVPESSKYENDQDDDAKDPLPEFPVKLEVMSDDDDYEPTEIRAEDLLTIDAKFPEDSPTVTSQRTPRVNKNGGVGSSANSRNGKSVANGRNVRKQPEDDDDEEEDDEDDEEEEDDDEGSDFDVENEFNDGLDELLQKAQATKSKSASGGLASKAVGSAATKPANTSGLVIETITSGNGTTITATGASSTSIPTTGKISVVPTNLLMKQPSSVASSLTTPIQIYTQPTVSIAKGVGTGTTAMVATAGTGTGTAPMKLLLVNTVGKDGKTQQILTPASEATATMPKLIPAPVHHSKIPLSVPGQSPIVTIPTVNVPKKVGEPIQLRTTGARTGGASGGQSAGFRTLLTQLVAIQRENLALNQERLALEKERLEFEKQFGGSLVGMVRNMNTFFSGMLYQQRKEQQQQLKETLHEPQPSNKSVEPQTKRTEGVKTPTPPPPPPVPAVAAEGLSALEGREITSSASSPSSASRVASPTSTTKAAPTTDSGNETKERTTGTKRTEPSSTPPSLTPAPSIAKPSSTSDVSPLPKKRRMMTRNSAQHTQSSASSATEDPLKTEIISDADDP